MWYKSAIHSKCLMGVFIYGCLISATNRVFLRMYAKSNIKIYEDITHKAIVGKVKKGEYVFVSKELNEYLEIIWKKKKAYVEKKYFQKEKVVVMKGILTLLDDGDVLIRSSMKHTIGKVKSGERHNVVDIINRGDVRMFKTDQGYLIVPKPKMFIYNEVEK